ncbi:MAG: L-asparagine permease, partial [Microbacterium sp.]
PYGGILITASIGVAGVILNFFVPERAFEIVLNLAGIGIVGTWMSIMICHWLFLRKAKRGEVERPAFRLPLAPVTNIVTLVFLVMVVVLMAMDANVGRLTLAFFGLIVVALVIGWFVIRDRINPDALIDLGDASELPAGDESRE